MLKTRTPSGAERDTSKAMPAAETTAADPCMNPRTGLVILPSRIRSVTRSPYREMSLSGATGRTLRPVERNPMCRSIKTLRNPEMIVADEDIEAAALQFVRKISGYRAPSRANQKVFDRAVREISRSSRKMLDELVVRA